MTERNKEDTVLFKLVGLIIAASILGLIVLMLLNISTVEASGTQYWMILHEGYAGLNFSCAATNPYAEVIPAYAASSEMTVEQYTPYAEHPNDLVLRMQIVEVEYCNLDNIYEGRGDDYSFVWRFSERVTDGHEDHVHFTRGAAWIQLLDFREYEN